ncbi:MAG: SLC13 family permease [Calditrichaeota bacterium]|nr:MAG: SLC13 family permease [Calditrichota bacterium]
MIEHFDLWYTAFLLILMSVFLVKEWVEIELAIFSTLLLLVVGRVITIHEAFSGFSNEGMLTIAMLFVMAGALNNSGILTQITALLFGSNNTSTTRKLLRILFPVSAISAFMNNTPVVAMLIPAIRSWANKNNYAPSKFLIPISYAAILGGMCTLIGTSTTLIVHGLMIDYGLKGMTLFEISKVGIPLAVLGVLFISFLGHHLLPEKKEPLVELGEQTREFVIELKVTPEYENVGKTIEGAGLRHLKGLFLFQIERDGNIIAPAGPDERIQVGDRLFFTGVPKTILELQKTPGLQLTKDSHFDLKQYDSSKIKTFECVISPGSPLVGKTVRESNFRGKYEAVIIAIHRHGERVQQKVGDIVLKAGDTLLVLADKTFRSRWYHSNDFYLIAGAETVPSKPKWQAYLSLITFITVILFTVLKILPLLAAVGLGVVVLIATRTITPTEVRAAVDWRVLIIIAMSLGIAHAVDKSGLAAEFANVLVQLSSNVGSLGALIGIYLVTSVYTIIITSNATAALLFPVAYSTAKAINGDPHAFAITVVIAAAASFATPISYQTNLMVYGAGGYRFSDFLKIGIPLQILTGVFAIGLIYYFYL